MSLKEQLEKFSLLSLDNSLITSAMFWCANSCRWSALDDKCLVIARVSVPFCDLLINRYIDLLRLTRLVLLSW